MNNKIRSFLKNKRMLLILILLGSGLLLISLFGGGRVEDADTAEEYKAALEDELEELCSSLDGVGRCRVKLSLSSSEVGKDGRTPRVEGVVVICRGAASATVRKELTELFSSLYGLPSTRISVLKFN